MTNPLILNIEAATGVCSVCLSRGDELLSLHESSEQNAHSRVITLLVQRCMAEAGLSLADIDAVAVSEGPGSYTSLRVGFATAKGLCYALDKPLITISTLSALANAAFQEVRDTAALYCPMIDARRMEVYMALFDAKGNEVDSPRPMVIEEGAFGAYISRGQRLIFCGDGTEKCKKLLVEPLFEFSSIVKCSSTQIISLAHSAFLNNKFVNILNTSPLYLKPPNITSSKQG